MRRRVLLCALLVTGCGCTSSPETTKPNYYHPDRGDLVGFTMWTDAPNLCPEGSARDREAPTFAGMTPDIEQGLRCHDACLVCSFLPDSTPLCPGPEFDSLRDAGNDDDAAAPVRAA